MVHSLWGLLLSVLATFMKDDGEDFGRRRLVILFVTMAIQVLVFGVTLCALGVLYMLGMYISAGVSLWRLIEHDFGDAGGANLRPALQVLYILAVAQGVLFGYKTIYALLAGSRLSNAVARGSSVDKGLMQEYIEETIAGCEKDPSFAGGRNFVTYGVNLMMEDKSNESFIAGIKALGGVIKPENEPGRKVLAKYLLTRSSDFLSAIIQRLLEAVGPRSPYSREIKEHVVRILDIIAHCIRLEQFPRAIECLLCLLCFVVDTSQVQGNHTEDDHKFKDYERMELLEGYEKLYVENELRIGSPDSLLGTLRKKLYCCLPCKRKEVENKNDRERKIIILPFDPLPVKAVNIIHRLAADEYNRRIMRTCVSNTLLYKIAMLPTKLHRENHDPFNHWLQYAHRLESDRHPDLRMLEQCWVLTEWLLVDLTETSGPPLPVQTAATPVGEGRGSEEIEVEVEEDEEQFLLRSMDGSALGSTIKRAIKDSIESTIKCIFDCLDCGGTQKMQAIQILLHLSLDISIIIKDSESSKRRLRWVLLLIVCDTGDDSKAWMVPRLTHRNKNCSDLVDIRRLAGEKLSEMLREKHGELPSEASARELQSIRLALEDLISASCADAEDISTRINAIMIMEELCVLYSFSHTRHEYIVVRELLVGAIPEMVKKTLNLCGCQTAEKQEQPIDEENGEVSQDNPNGDIDTQRLRKALVSLCFIGCYHPRALPSSDLTLRSKFKEIASKICKEQGKSLKDFECLLRYST